MKTLFRPVDIATLVFFRIVFGILVFIDLLNSWIYYHLKKDAYNPLNFQFKYYGFEWVHPFPEPYMTAIFILLMVAALLVALGEWYVISSTILAFGFTYTYFLEKAHYLNHGYLMCWICFVMIFLPANRGFSIDVLKRPQNRLNEIPYWPLFLIQFLMGVVYFYGGIAKINPDWFQAHPMRAWLGNKTDIPVLGYFFQYTSTAYFMSYGGLFLDLFIVLFLAMKRTRIWAFGFVLFFHVMNHILFGIGVFPFLSIALTSLYFPPNWPRKWAAWLESKLPFLRRFGDWYRNSVGKTPPAQYDEIWQGTPSNRPIIIAVFVALALFHVSIPWRHHFYPGNVAWTEEGHRYSWRMMLRSKRGYGHFIVKDVATGAEEKIKPRKVLGSKQNRKMYTHPDMIIQYAHHLRDEYAAQGKEVEVYAHIKVKLNQRKYQPFIDETVDLAQEEWHFFRPSPWIIPLEEGTADQSQK